VSYAGKAAEVGGDELYKLRDVPGIWNESCLKALT